jgi:spore germination protein YaaH
MMKRILAFTMSFLLIASMMSSSYAVTHHWSTSLKNSLIENKVLNTSDTLRVGDTVSYNQFSKLLNRFGLGEKISLKESDIDITRIGALKLVMDQLGYTYLANQIKELDVPFSDIKDDKGYVRLGLDLGMISLSYNGLFRPFDTLVSEECIALLYHLYRINHLNLSSLMSYYAISSYSQIGYTNALDTIAYGWSRLELDSESNIIRLNTTATNRNTFRVPSGYSEPITRAVNANVERLLMVSVEDSFVDSKPLTEAIISKNVYMQQAVNAIISTMKNTQDSLKFTGVLIDFESLKGTENANDLSLFASTLKSQLADLGLSLAIAVHPVRKEGMSYYDGYNYRRLGQIADKVILMAHDYYPKRLTQEEMASGITITPLTPIQDIYYALKGILDPVTGVQDHSKIVFQLSMDAAQWKLRDGKIINERPYSPTSSAILSRINQNVTPQFSNELKSTFLIFQDPIDETRNVIWYEDERSVDAKINLALSMGVSNFSVWRLGTIPSAEDNNAYLNVWENILEYQNTP